LYSSPFQSQSTCAGCGGGPHSLEAGQVPVEDLVERGLFGLPAGIGVSRRCGPGTASPGEGLHKQPWTAAGRSQGLPRRPKQGEGFPLPYLFLSRNEKGPPCGEPFGSNLVARRYHPPCTLGLTRSRASASSRPR
jgi:hypothetical protein